MGFMDDPGHVAEIQFVLVDSTGHEDPVVRSFIEVNAFATVSLFIDKVISKGGIWSSDVSTFHPWHSIVKVKWARKKMNPAELNKEEVGVVFRRLHPELFVEVENDDDDDDERSTSMLTAPTLAPQ